MMFDAPLYLTAPHSDPQFFFFAPENELTGSAAVAALSTSFIFHSLSVQWKASN